MNGKATLEIKLSPTRIAVHQRGPVKIGTLLPALLERYGLDQPRPAVVRRHVQDAALRLGQRTLAELG